MDDSSYKTNNSCVIVDTSVAASKNKETIGLNCHFFVSNSQMLDPKKYISIFKILLSCALLNWIISAWLENTYVHVYLMSRWQV